MEIKNPRGKIILFLFLISLTSSIILSTRPVGEICDITIGCEVVHYSKYNYLFGIQNSNYGIIIFSILSLLAFSQLIKPTKNKKAIIIFSIIIGFLVALYFLYIQHFILKAYCKYCLIVDFSMILALLLIIPELKKGLFVLTKNKQTV